MTPLRFLLHLAIALSFVNPIVIGTPTDNGKCSTITEKYRIFVLSDITNEPDDSMSFVRMLAHSDMYSIQGMVATTSTWLNHSTAPEEMKEIIKAYEVVRPNLQTHSDGQFPTASYLLPLVKSGPKTFGQYAIDALEAGGRISEGAKLLIDKVDADGDRLFVMIWGGANTLAEALWEVRKRRSQSQLAGFISKLSVYSISDQDNSGFWLRSHFPQLRWIASIHGWNDYSAGAWAGMADVLPGANSDVVSNQWLAQNIQVGPLGKAYPNVTYGVEGDSPSLLFMFQNGLNSPEHPEWGGWGGRYMAVAMGAQLFSNTYDTVVGIDEQTYKSAEATIWRWREAFQNEFAARMQWTLRERSPNSNISHPPIIKLNGTCSLKPYEIETTGGTTLVLNAVGTYDQDTGSSDALDVKWFQYTESTYSLGLLFTSKLNITVAPQSNNLVAQIQLPPPSQVCGTIGAGGQQPFKLCPVWHVILQVKGSGPNGMTRYRRVLIKMKS